MEEARMRGRLAVVTGATGGIGAEICRTLRGEGYVVLAQYHRGEMEAEKLSRELSEAGAGFYCVSADLAHASGASRVVSYLDEVLSHRPDLSLSALVNNAAKLLGPSFAEATRAQFDEYFDLNVKAPFFLSQSLAGRMGRGGAIVNISSASAHFSSPGDIVYAMSKAAVESLTINMAEAIAPRGLRVNAVVPGFTDNGHIGFQIPEVREYMSSFAVLGDVSDASVVARAVSFLLSDDASRTTGSILDVSGGSLLGARGKAAGSVREMLPAPHLSQPGQAVDEVRIEPS